MAGAGDPRPLAGRGIVITRPAGQASALARLIEARGGRAILFPVLEIVDVPDRSAMDALVDRLHEFDIAIFISVNAAVRAMSAIRARRDVPDALSIVAIGGATAREALERQGIASVIAPQVRADSEAALALPALQAVRGKRVVIFRGVGGREVLRHTLTERGAHVEYGECYQRLRPNPDVAPLIAAMRSGEAAAVVCTSSEGLRNLWDLLRPEGQSLLGTLPVFVPHPRIASAARALGLARVIVTGRGDEGIAASVADHFSPVA